jgi:hypothetical protein
MQRPGNLALAFSESVRRELRRAGVHVRRGRGVDPRYVALQDNCRAALALIPVQESRPNRVA